MSGQLYRVRGQVQGVGFRPAVWKLASEMGFTGDVRNTNCGAEIRLWGQEQQTFIDRLYAELPQLAEIEEVEIDPLSGCLLYTSPSPRDRQKSRMPSSA